jgi:DNA topoisomerase-3
VYNFLNCNKPFKRLWISSLTEKEVKKGFENLLDPKETYFLGKSAYARAIADWLVGVNGTQASTLQFGDGKLLTIGRVQTAILKIICERYLENLNFEKKISYKLRANHIDDNVPFFSETEIYETLEQANSIKNKISDYHKLIDIETNIKIENAPLLYSIDTLIIDANRYFKYTGQKTLDVAQSLYEKKLTSYPRTDSTYINQENFNNLKGFLTGFAKNILQVEYSFTTIPKSVNDKKLTGSHDAIVPTGVEPNFNVLSEEESSIFKLILSRCLQSFSEPAEYKKFKYIFINNEIKFLTYNSLLLKKGWKTYLLSNDSTDEKKEDQQVQNLNIKINDPVKIVDFELKEVETKPPTLYSEVNLTSDLTNFGKLLKEKNPDLLSTIKSNIDINSLQIGTQATRPGIIERLKYLGFITLKKNNFIPTEDGLKYYMILKDLKISDVITTAIWEMKLKNIVDGQEDIRVFYNDITHFTSDIVKDIFSKEIKIEFNSNSLLNLGKCPKCNQGSITEGKLNYYCSQYKTGCDFTIWKTIGNKKLSESVIKTLLSKKQTSKIKGFKNKDGKPFEASLKLDNNLKVKYIF